MGKRLLAVMLSVLLLGANTSFAAAQEETAQASESKSDSSESSKTSETKSEASESSKTSGAKSEASESSKTSGAKSEASENGKTSETKSEASESSKTSESKSDSSENGKTSESKSDSSESGDASEGKSEASESGKTSEDKGDSSENGEAGMENKDAASESEADGKESETDGEDAGENGEQTEGKLPEDENDAESGAEEPAQEAEEKSFVNKTGEEIKPSSLVGTDYETIAENYDGEANVLKKYIPSDEYGENIILDSYVDEDGNLVVLISQGAAVPEEDGKKTASTRGDAPAVDGSFSGWDEIPSSYEYNWDNSQNCWQWGEWKDGVCYKTEEGTYDSNVRHEMKLYSDGENVYLKIKYATIYSGTQSNGDDYNFYIDGKQVKYHITWDNAQSITGATPGPGTYQVDVRNGDYDISGTVVDGAVAYYHVTEDQKNNELELKIPLSAFQMQNGEIDLDNYSVIQFFTPNLMYRRIGVAGSPTGAIPFAAGAFLLVPAGYVWLKKREEMGAAHA
jgi:hypothetical protein